jgi:hypothetical protein
MLHSAHCIFLFTTDADQAGQFQERSRNGLQNLVRARTVRSVQEQEEHGICMTEISSEERSGERSAGRSFSSALASSKVQKQTVLKLTALIS